jgi:hypothetical protein
VTTLTMTAAGCSVVTSPLLSAPLLRSARYGQTTARNGATLITSRSGNGLLPPSLAARLQSSMGACIRQQSSLMRRRLRFGSVGKKGLGRTSSARCTPPALTSLRSMLRAFGTEKSLRYNDIIRWTASQVGGNVTVLDAYAVTYNSPSIDGQHYYQAPNADLAQVTLNLLAAMHRGGLC